LSTALHLSESGANVAVIDAAEPGWGASGRNGGQIIPGFKAERTILVRTLGAENGNRLFAWSGEFADFTLQLIRRRGIECQASRSGWIQPAHSYKSLEAYRVRVDEWGSLGAQVRVIDAKETERLLGTTWYKGAYIDPRGGRLHPLNYARGLAKAAQKNGARVYTLSPVKQLAPSAGGWLVKSDFGFIRTTQVVLCTNAYTALNGSGSLWPKLGRSIIPVPSYMIATEPLGDNVRGGILPEGQTAADLKRLTNHFRLEPDGRLLFGGRGGFGNSEDPRSYAPLISRLHQYFPQLGDVAIEYRWSGHVALTMDHVPHLHRPAKGVVIAIGCNGRGVGMATSAGKVVADLICGRRDEESPIPLTNIKPIPFHGFRRPAMEIAVWWKSVRDWIEHKSL
jgi:glycine/D-amino acid oxidase-like deaminating enzyme